MLCPIKVNSMTIELTLQHFLLSGPDYFSRIKSLYKLIEAFLFSSCYLYREEKFRLETGLKQVLLLVRMPKLDDELLVFVEEHFFS